MTVRVFLVEDLQSTRGLLEELFAAIEGLELVASATTEAEANFWLEENLGAWDLAIVDLVLDQGTGMGVVTRCKTLAPAAQVVVFSSYMSPGIRIHCLRLGADAAFSKTESAELLQWLARQVQGGGPDA